MTDPDAKLDFETWYRGSLGGTDRASMAEGDHRVACKAGWDAAVQALATASLSEITADRDRLLATLNEIREAGTKTYPRLYGDMYAGEYEDITEVSAEAEIADAVLSARGL